RRRPPGVGVVAQPGLLDRVLGLAHAAEDPVGDGEQQRPQLLELLGPVHDGSPRVGGTPWKPRMANSSARFMTVPLAWAGLRGKPRMAVTSPTSVAVSTSRDETACLFCDIGAPMSQSGPAVSSRGRRTLSYRS